jgi:hypothetical protein
VYQVDGLYHWNRCYQTRFWHLSSTIGHDRE